MPPSVDRIECRPYHYGEELSLSRRHPSSKPGVMPHGAVRFFVASSGGMRCPPLQLHNDTGFPLKTCGNDRRGGVLAGFRPRPLLCSGGISCRLPSAYLPLFRSRAIPGQSPGHASWRCPLLGGLCGRHEMPPLRPIEPSPLVRNEAKPPTFLIGGQGEGEKQCLRSRAIPGQSPGHASWRFFLAASPSRIRSRGYNDIGFPLTTGGNSLICQLYVWYSYISDYRVTKG